MCWGKAAIIQELEAPTPLAWELALAVAACSTFGQMVRQALRGIEWSFGRHLVERRRTASLPLSSILAESALRNAWEGGRQSNLPLAESNRAVEGRNKRFEEDGSLLILPRSQQVHEGQSVCE